MKISILDTAVVEDGTKGWSVVVEARLLRSDTAASIFRHFKLSEDHSQSTEVVDIHGGSCIHMEYKDDGVSVQCGKSISKDYPSGWLCKYHQMEVNKQNHQWMYVGETCPKDISIRNFNRMMVGTERGEIK